MRMIWFPVLFVVILLSCSGPKQANTSDPVTWQMQAIQKEGLANFFHWSEDRIPFISAHRGGPYPGYPENAIETFEYITQQVPVIIECDIAMTKDSVLILMHDLTLDRTTNGSGIVTDHHWVDLKKLFLKDETDQITEFRIPSLADVFVRMKDKALFTLDIKRGVPLHLVIEAMEKYNMQESAAIISYRADQAKAIHELNDALMISVGIGSLEAYMAHKRLGIPDENMIAFVGVAEPDLSLYAMLHEKGIFTILGVLGNLDKMALTKGDQLYADWVGRGADILATDRPLEAAQVIMNMWPKESEKYKFIKK